MKAVVYSLLTCIFCSLIFSAEPLKAQDSIRRPAQIKAAPVKNIAPAFDRRALLIDSLGAMIVEMESREDSLYRALSSQNEKISDANTEIEALKAGNAELKLQLEDAQGDNLQSSHTNSILFIFNIGVGIFLLIGLIWMFMRKKGDAESDEQPARNDRRKVSNANENFDHKLDRIQKLGNLRDKGLLTDDEFNLQKRQILGE
ncbi:MAG: SHOCT domain-containing protein [Bacteroidetes bacterium]|nr:SHOCT domain-containing protein [Bacteroidota bacterium]MBL0098119.1 SHOCT domain-containing protein [Bacteroidota bacterium]